jgi:heme A synthase
MAMTSIERQNAAGAWADVLAIGFGTTVSMWAVGYVCRLPPAIVPSWLLLLLLLACMLAGGFIAGRQTGGGWRRGLAACLLASVLNLLILGGLLSGAAGGGSAPAALWWVPSFLAVSAALGCVGATVGQAFRGRQAPRERNWVGAWAKVLVAATLLLLIIGGMVTGYEAGLSVVDWPNSFGCNMFLYPLSRMTGGVYYEHSHRLFGSLVGLTTLTLALYLQKNESRVWLRRFVWLALATVIAQGILGGLRVTGRFTLSASPDDTAPSIALAIVHGTLGQVFFAMTVSIAVFTSTTWKPGGPGREPAVRSSASTDRALQAILVALLIVQLVLGAILRHIFGGLFIHMTMAAIVILVAVGAGSRAWGLYADQPILHRLGRMLLALAGVQVLLGITAYIAAGATAGMQPRPAADVILTTAHQATGALVLVVATMLMLWSRRLLVPVTACPALKS